MITQIKKYGSSHVIVLTKEFMKFHNIKEKDWIDISDVVKINKEGKNNER